MRAALLILALATPCWAGQAAESYPGVTMKMRSDFNTGTATSREGYAAYGSPAFLKKGVFGGAMTAPAYAVWYQDIPSMSLLNTWVHAWVKINGTYYPSIYHINRCVSGNHSQLFYHNQPNARLEYMEFNGSSWSTVITAGNIVDGRWHMVDVVRQGRASASIDIFIDGKLVAQGTGWASLSETPTRFIWGGQGCGADYDSISFDDGFYALHSGIGSISPLTGYIKRLFHEGRGRYAQ